MPPLPEQMKSELYLPAPAPAWAQPQIYETTISVKDANGTAQGGCFIVPGCRGRSFVPVNVWWQCTGSATGSSLVLLEVVDAAGNVVCSHVKADCTNGTWVTTKGGTVVTTNLGLATAIGTGLKFKPTGADIETTTSIRIAVLGFYL